MRNSRRFLGQHLAAVLAAVLGCLVLVGLGQPPALAASYTPITGEGSSWAANAIDDWDADVVNKGIKVNFGATGSVAGLTGFAQGTDDFAASDIPYGVQGTSPNAPGRGFAYIPDVAGGTALMYNLSVGGKQFTNLKLSGPTIAGIFEGNITQWNDPKIEADNPGVALPPLKITPVVRSDGSGSTAQFTLWMKSQYPSIWTCGELSFFTQCNKYNPTTQQAKSGDNSVAGFVQSNAGTIGYVEYSYALALNFPVAKVLNKAGFYVLPTASNVAVALLKAKIDMTPGRDYLTQQLDGVYVDPDPRAYPISSYSYFVIPTQLQNGFTTAKGYTLGSYTQYALCEGQQAAPTLGYSPLPINLAEAGLAQVKKIPGASTQTINIKNCHNPTFSTNGTNTLAADALYPDLCDKYGAKATCVYGTPVSGKKSASTNGQTDNNSVGNHTSGTSTNTVSTTGTPSSTTTAPGVTTSGGTRSGATTSGGTTPSTGGVGTAVPGSAPGGTAPAAGSTGPGSSNSISLLNPDGKTTCDPDTGRCTLVSASPEEVPAAHGALLSRWTVWLAIFALLALILVPPVFVLVGRRR